MKDRLKGALQFIHHEAAGAVLLLVAAMFGYAWLKWCSEPVAGPLPPHPGK